MPTLSNFIQHTIGSISHSNQTKKKRNEKNPNWKKKKNCHCLHMARYHIENPKDVTKKKFYKSSMI